MTISNQLVLPNPNQPYPSPESEEGVRVVFDHIQKHKVNNKRKPYSKPAKSKAEITVKQKIFCDEYFKTGSVTKACWASGYNERAALQTLKRDNVQTYLYNLRVDVLQREGVLTKPLIVDKLSSVASVCIPSDVVEMARNMDLKEKLVMTQVLQTGLKAIDILCKVMGYFAPPAIAEQKVPDLKNDEELRKIALLNEEIKKRTKEF